MSALMRLRELVSTMHELAQFDRNGVRCLKCVIGTDVLDFGLTWMGIFDSLRVV